MGARSHPDARERFGCGGAEACPQTFSCSVDAAGRVFVVDRENNRVQEFGSEGTFLAKWGGRGVCPGEFAQPTAIAVSCSGAVYVADTHNNRIQVFVPVPPADSGCAPAGSWPPPLDVAELLVTVEALSDRPAPPLSAMAPPLVVAVLPEIRTQEPTTLSGHHVKLAFDRFPFGIVKRRLREGQSEEEDDWRLGHPVIFPHTLCVGNQGLQQFQVRVPIDDENTWHLWYSRY